MERLYKGSIMALVPIYLEEGGNSTQVYLEGEEVFVLEYTMRTILKKLARKYMLDLQEVRKRYKPLITTPNIMPIAFSKENVFIPLKTRSPMFAKDGALSYINGSYIKGVKSSPKGGMININGEHEIECLWSVPTIKRHLRNGTIISKFYEESRMQGKKFDWEGDMEGVIGVREGGDIYCRILIPRETIDILRSEGEKD